jgi:hypothetical protein
MKQLVIQETGAPGTFVVTAGGPLALYTGSKECCEAVKQTLERYAAWVVGEPDARGGARMTAFEEQVGEALCNHAPLERVEPGDAQHACGLCLEMAPRVAAAIVTAMNDAAAEALGPGQEDYDGVRMAALVALRGKRL